MTWLADTLHPSFTRIFRSDKFASDPAAQAAIKESGKKEAWENLTEIDGLLSQRALDDGCAIHHLRSLRDGVL